MPQVLPQGVEGTVKQFWFQSGPEKYSQHGQEIPLVLMHVTTFIEKPLSAEDTLMISFLPLRLVAVVLMP
jgi:hypothetical protein